MGRGESSAGISSLPRGIAIPQDRAGAERKQRPSPAAPILRSSPSCPRFEGTDEVEADVREEVCARASCARSWCG